MLGRDGLLLSYSSLFSRLNYAPALKHLLLRTACEDFCEITSNEVRHNFMEVPAEGGVAEHQ
jgi:hypothetical protein